MRYLPFVGLQGSSSLEEQPLTWIRPCLQDRQSLGCCAFLSSRSMYFKDENELTDFDPIFVREGYGFSISQSSAIHRCAVQRACVTQPINAFFKRDDGVRPEKSLLSTQISDSKLRPIRVDDPRIGKICALSCGSRGITRREAESMAVRGNAGTTVGVSTDDWVADGEGTGTKEDGTAASGMLVILPSEPISATGAPRPPISLARAS